MALVALTTDNLSAPRRIEGHTSNVVAPIQHQELGDIVVGTLAAAATFVIPTALKEIDYVGITGTNAGGSVVVHAAPVSPAIVAEAIGAAANEGATTITLGASASAVNDVYNGCTIKIQMGGNLQTTQILDYVGATKVATLADGLEVAATTAATLVEVLGIIVTSIAGATTPSYSINVIGKA